MNGTEFHTGDCVLLNSGDMDKPFVAVIKSLYRTSKGNFLTARWFFRLEDTNLDAKKVPPNFPKNGLFLSNETDCNSVSSILGIVEVASDFPENVPVRKASNRRQGKKKCGTKNDEGSATHGPFICRHSYDAYRNVYTNLLVPLHESIKGYRDQLRDPDCSSDTDSDSGRHERETNITEMNESTSASSLKAQKVSQDSVLLDRCERNQKGKKAATDAKSSSILPASKGTKASPHHEATFSEDIPSKHARIGDDYQASVEIFAKPKCSSSEMSPSSQKALWKPSHISDVLVNEYLKTMRYKILDRQEYWRNMNIYVHSNATNADKDVAFPKGWVVAKVISLGVETCDLEKQENPCENINTMESEKTIPRFSYEAFVGAKLCKHKRNLLSCRSCFEEIRKTSSSKNASSNGTVSKNQNRTLNVVLLSTGVIINHVPFEKVRGHLPSEGSLLGWLVEYDYNIHKATSSDNITSFVNRLLKTRWSPEEEKAFAHAIHLHGNDFRAAAADLQKLRQNTNVNDVVSHLAWRDGLSGRVRRNLGRSTRDIILGKPKCDLSRRKFSESELQNGKIQAGSKVLRSRQWRCSVCTVVNQATKYCSVCGSSRSSEKRITDLHIESRPDESIFQSSSEKETKKILKRKNIALSEHNVSIEGLEASSTKQRISRQKNEKNGDTGKKKSEAVKKRRKNGRKAEEPKVRSGSTSGGNTLWDQVEELRNLEEAKRVTKADIGTKVNVDTVKNFENTLISRAEAFNQSKVPSLDRASLKKESNGTKMSTEVNDVTKNVTIPEFATVLSSTYPGWVQTTCSTTMYVIAQEHKIPVDELVSLNRVRIPNLKKGTRFDKGTWIEIGLSDSEGEDIEATGVLSDYRSGYHNNIPHATSPNVIEPTKESAIEFLKKVHARFNERNATDKFAPRKYNLFISQLRRYQMGHITTKEVTTYVTAVLDDEQDLLRSFINILHGSRMKEQ
eukprot:g944.t1